jgi:hypothetical protein
MPDRFARCPNTDYCSLADRRMVLRLAEDESFYCPECAHALTAAPPWGTRRTPWAVFGAVGMAGAATAACYLVAQNWPTAMAYVPRSVSTALALFAPAAPPPPDLIAIITGNAPTEPFPTPQQFLVAATMDSWLPRQAGDHVLRRRNPRPPRSDPAAAAARASLEAGVPPLSDPEADYAGAAMPWRQALIIAALVTPSQPMPIAIPASPTAAPPQSPAAPPASPPPNTTPAIKPHASLANPPRETDAEHKLELALADGFIRGIRPDDSGLTNHVIPPQAGPPQAGPPRPAPAKTAPAAAASPPAAIATAASPRTQETGDRSHVTNATSGKTTLGPGPKEAPKAPGHPAATAATSTATIAAHTAARPTTKQLGSARIPAPPPTVAANILSPTRRKLSLPAMAPTQAARSQQKPAPQFTAATPGNAARPPAAATPYPTTVVLAPPAANTGPKGVANAGFTGLKYGALTDANLASIPTVASTERLSGGSMMVDCEVPASGVPTDCRLLQSDKSPAVAHAVLAMLTSGLVHKTPKSEHGHLVRQSWPINFPVPTPHRAETLEPEDPPP